MIELCHSHIIVILGSYLLQEGLVITDILETRADRIFGTHGW